MQIRAAALASPILALMLAAPVGAEPPVLSLPIDCVPGEDCWVVNLVDIDPGPEARDFQCGDHTYDGHKGFDIAIAGERAMASGVSVLAAAPGTVAGIRDGMDDIDVSTTGRDVVKGRECGNGVLVQGADGWQHQYCHLRKGSVSVAEGQTIRTGDTLGHVGMSGLAQFPHVHLTVRRDQAVVDPHTGAVVGDRPCDAETEPRGLWSPEAAAAIADSGSVIYLSGFHDSAPEAARARAGDYDAPVILPSAAALVVWLDMFRPDAGDELRIRLSGPNNRLVVDKRITIEKDQARRFIFIGRKRTLPAWPVGMYTAEITLTRTADGTVQTHRISQRIE